MSHSPSHNSDNEEDIISCSPVQVSPSDVSGNATMEKENIAIISEHVGNDLLTNHQLNNKNSSEYLSSSAHEIEKPGGVSEKDKKSNSCNVENVKFCQHISTPGMCDDAAVYTRHVSDKTPLMKDESSVTGSSSDWNTEGENETSETSCECSYLGDKDSDLSSLNNVSITSQTRENLMIPGSIRVPIVGHETVEARTKFTMFKIHVIVEADDEGWFIFRRYSDFVHLNDQLKILFPNFRLSLPPKRWFRSNFDLEFLEERLLGLQAFVDNITGHRDICKSKPVRDFFCFDDPPGPNDSLENSRAQCESMEETLYQLKSELSEKDTELQLLREELDLYKNQVQLLTSRLSELNRRSSFERSGSEKHRSPSTVGQIGIGPLLESGDQLLTNKLDMGSKLRSPELRRSERPLSGTDA